MLYGPLLLSLVREEFPARPSVDGVQVTCSDSIIPDVWMTRPGQGGTAAGTHALLVYQDVGGVPTYFSEGAMADKSNVRLQLTVWAERPGDRHAIVRRLMKAVARHPQFEPLTTPAGTYSEAMQLYGATFDVSCWYDDL